MRMIEIAIRTLTIMLLLHATPPAAARDAEQSPIEFLQTMSRGALKNTGAVRHEMEGPEGKLVYWVAGNGRVVILVHGTNDQAGLWWRTVAALGESYQVVVPDMPGHGESDPATGALDMAMMRNALKVLIDAVSPRDPVLLVGNSMGGWASLLYTLDHPERVERLILEDSGGITLEAPASVTLVPTTIEEARALFDAALATDGVVPDPILEDFVERAPGSPAARLLATPYDGYLLDDRLGAIRAPTTLIWGEEDGILPLSFGKRMESMIENATMIVIPGCGHIVHNECPEAFNSTLNRALSLP